MIRHTLFLVSALVMAASTGHAQTGGNKKNDPGEVEMTFANGSVVRMALVPGEIEVSTAFGKLVVPVREIRRIDFGLHLPEGLDKQIDATIKQLGSADYKQREAAARELVALGVHAYPFVLVAARSKDLETSKRAQDVLAKIKARVPAKDLYLSEDDKVVTSRFTIVGRILNPAIKAKSEYFADAEHSLTKLRHLRLLTDSRESEVVVDAAKYGLANQWLDTGINVESAGTLSITASGDVDLRPSLPGTYVCGPKGYTRLVAGGFGKVKKGGFDGARAYPGTLLGRIGTNGDTFVIGDRFEAPLDREGKLYLQIMSSPYDTNSTGSYQVKVSVRE
jgi:hypothetical protein